MDLGASRTAVRLVLGVMLAAVVPASIADAASPGSGFIFQRNKPAAFESSHTFQLRGTRNADGSCHYDYPTLSVPAGQTVWEARDIAIDPVKCIKLLEEGRPTATTADVAGDGKLTANADQAGVSSIAALATSGVASGYHWVWWEDVLGIKLTQDKTYISWNYDGHCAGSGSTSGEWTWSTGLHWEIVSYSANEYESCSYYRGESKSKFRDSWFCAPLPTVYTYYYSVRAFGYEDGTIYGTRSTDSVDECAPLWMHYQIKKTT
jgi:hypothetical protein